MEERMPNTKINPAGKPGEVTFWMLVLPSLISFLLLIDPFFIDVQIIRPKLLVIELGVFVISIAWVIRVISQGKLEVRNTSLNLPIALYILYILFAYSISEDKFVAVSEFKRVILCSLIYFLVVNSTDINQKIHRLQLGIIFSGWVTGSAIIMFYGLMQHWGTIRLFGLVMDAPKMERVFATFGNPIFFAAHLVIFLPIVLGLFFYSASRKAYKSGFKIIFLRCLLLFIFIAGLLTLYFTKTRASWIGISCSLAIFGILNINSKKLRLIFISIFLILAVVFVVLTSTVWLRQQAHVLIWRDTLNMWLHHPVLGTGPGTFHINFPNYASAELLSVWPQTSSIVNDAHNEYVEILAETGIIGFGIFAWVLFSFFKYAFRKSGQIKSVDPGMAYIFTGAICSAIAILIQNFFSVDMRFLISAFYLFLVIGILYSFKETSYVKYLKFDSSVKAVIISIVLLVAGVFGYENSFKVHLLSLVHLDLRAAKVEIRPAYEGTGMLPNILRPYLAQKTLSAQPDFFDEKVLEPARNLSDLKALLKKYPGEAKIYEKLGWIYAKEKDFNNAIASYLKATELNPNLPGPYNNLGNIFYLTGNKSRAIECYRMSVKRFPGIVDSHLNLGILYYYQGMLKESADEFNTVLKIDPKNEKAIVMLKKMRE